MPVQTTTTRTADDAITRLREAAEDALNNQFENAQAYRLPPLALASG